MEKLKFIEEKYLILPCSERNVTRIMVASFQIFPPCHAAFIN